MGVGIAQIYSQLVQANNNNKNHSSARHVFLGESTSDPERTSNAEIFPYHDIIMVWWLSRYDSCILHGEYSRNIPTAHRYRMLLLSEWLLWKSAHKGQTFIITEERYMSELTLEANILATILSLHQMALCGRRGWIRTASYQAVYDVVQLLRRCKGCQSCSDLLWGPTIVLCWPMIIG